MHEKSADELECGQTQSPSPSTSHFLVADGDMRIGYLDNSVIRNSNPKDIAREVFDSLLCRADRFAMDIPCFLPDAGARVFYTVLVSDLFFEPSPEDL